MKNKIIFSLYLLLGAIIPSTAQVKIGSNPNTINSNSLLEMESTTKGFLPPRVALTDLNAVTPLSGTVPAGMLVYSSSGTVPDGFYFWNGTKWINVTTSVTDRANYVLVKSASDFPAAVSGVITLVVGTLYEINGTITMTNKIELNGATLKGSDVTNDKLIYTPGSGELFTGTTGGNISTLTLSATGVGSKLFNINAGGAVYKSLITQYITIQNCDNIGLLKGFGGAVVFQTVIYINNSNGITFEDLGDFAGLDEIFTSTNDNTFQKFVGVFGTILILGGERFSLSASSATAIDVSGITSINYGAALKSTLFIGNGTYVNGSFSDKWEVESRGLNTEKDDVACGDLYISASVATTFTAVNTPVKVLGTTTSSDLFRVTSPANNRLTYTGTKTKKCMVMSTVALTSASNNKVYSFYIAKNGVIAPESKMTRKVATGADISGMSLGCILQMSTNDYLEVWAENNTDNTSMTVVNMNFIIK